MKIKHWQGYGTVDAKKVFLDESHLVVEVVGSHEYGLERNDGYDVFNWLVKRFDRKGYCSDWTYIADVTTKDWYERDPKSGLDVEHCLYDIRFGRKFGC